MSEFSEISQLELLEKAPEIIRDMVAEYKRRDIQWGSKPYSHAVQFLRYWDEKNENKA